jgi:glycosyltransferase involved in cell wall biosynthesis
VPSHVLIVIPAHHEAGNLAFVIDELRAVRTEDEILVVDDASSDGTAEVARRLGAGVVRLPLHLGYGGAVQTGVKCGRRRGHPVVVTFDADGQHDPRDVAGLVEAVDGGADLALGSRFLAKESHRGSLLRRSGRRLFSELTWALSGLPITDPTSGLKALGPRGQELFSLSRFPDRYPDADALVLARRLRLRLEERPARMRPSRNRRSMHSGLRVVAYTFNMLLSLLVAAAGHEADLRG